LERIAHRNNVWPRLGNEGYQAVVDQSLRYPPLKIDWRQSKSGIRTDVPGQISRTTLRAEFLPMVPFSFDRIDGKYYLAGETGTVSALGTYCSENPTGYNVVFAVWTGQGWEEIPQSSKLLDTATFNLLWHVGWTSKPKVPKLTVEEKSRREAIEYSPTMTVRQFLEKQKLTCRAMLRSSLPDLHTFPPNYRLQSTRGRIAARS
jgi:hypothetical protein